jgi:putative type IC restriction-modification system specificity subunit, partial
MTTTIDNEQKTLKVPNLRFPEFEGEWEENYVNEICNEFKSGKAIKADLILDVGTYPVFGGNGLRGYTSTYNHDGLFVLIGRQGALCGNVRSVIGKTYITEHAIAVNGNNKSDTNFLHYLFLQMDLGRFSDQSAQPGLAVNKLLKLKVITPRIDEQRKIANLLRLLDERIATQNKIIEDLKKLKSTIIDYAIGSLDTNFMKFGSVYETAREGGTPTTSNTSFYNNGKIPFIKIGDLKQKYLIENKDFITELGLQKSSAWLVPTHSILFSNGATIGEITITTYPVCTKQGILGIVPKANIDVEFLYYFMSSSYFKKAVSRIITEGTMKTAYLRNIDNILCPIPTKEKQLKIAKVPSALNLKIDSEQSILRLLYAQKRYLLHQMFR